MSNRCPKRLDHWNRMGLWVSVEAHKFAVRSRFGMFPKDLKLRRCTCGTHVVLSSAASSALATSSRVTSPSFSWSCPLFCLFPLEETHMFVCSKVGKYAAQAGVKWCTSRGHPESLGWWQAETVPKKGSCFLKGIFVSASFIVCIKDTEAI
jgi:hypothetical protein